MSPVAFPDPPKKMARHIAAPLLGRNRALSFWFPRHKLLLNTRVKGLRLSSPPGLAEPHGGRWLLLSWGGQEKTPASPPSN